MKPGRKLSFIAIIAFMGLAASVFAVTLRSALTFEDSEIPVIERTPEPLSDAPDPKRLVIPSLAINTLIEPVGINKKGNMQAPSSFSTVGWYKHGPKPGSQGTAAIAGHLNNGLGLAGVFENLKSIKIGAEIRVIGREGEEIRFAVTDIRTYSYRDDPKEVFAAPQGRAQLVLITCGGSWLKRFQTYSERLVVTAELYSD